MKFQFPVVPVLIRIAVALPRIVAQVSKEVEADKASDSDGGRKVTPAELGVIVGHIVCRLGDAILPTVAQANGIDVA
jgi:hypothetical protein